MTEIVVVNGKHKCGRFMDLRIIEVRKDEKDKSSTIIAWMIYGICEKCNVVLMHGMFIQSNKPVLDVDYIITNKVAKEAKKGAIYERYRKHK